MKLPFRLPFSLPELNLSEIFDFSRREIRIIVIAVSALLFCAVMITVIVIAAGSPDKSVQASAFTASAPPVVYDNGAVVIPASEKPFLSDFILSDDEMEERFTEAVNFREPIETWTDEQVQQYWIDLDEIAEDLMEMEAGRTIRNIFADVK